MGPGRPRLLLVAPLIFHEAALNERANFLHRQIGVGAIRRDSDHGPVIGGQHHQAHDAFPVDLLLTFFHPDFGLKRVAQLHEHGGRPGMQALPVPDGKVTLDGGWVHQFRGKTGIIGFSS